MNYFYAEADTALVRFGAQALRFSMTICLLALAIGIAHSQSIENSKSGDGIQESRDAIAQAWLDDLYAKGVTIRNDSVYFNDETRRIASDSIYRSIIFPQTYSWGIVQALMQNKAIKPAVWHLINLYHADTTNRSMVLQMILPLDQVLEMDRVILAAFYTYIAFDPEVYTMINGRSVAIKRPDIAEHKLIAAKAITDQIFAYRLSQR
jgi:hypothetical protein